MVHSLFLTVWKESCQGVYILDEYYSINCQKSIFQTQVKFMPYGGLYCEASPKGEFPNSCRQGFYIPWRCNAGDTATLHCLLCFSIPVPINSLAFKTYHEYLESQSKVNLVIMYPASPTETGQARKQNTVQRSEHNRNVGRDVQNIMGYRQSRFLLGSGVLGQVRG